MNVLELECKDLGYSWEEIEELLIYAIKLSRRRGLDFHFALNKKELLSICTSTIFEQYDNLKEMQSLDRVVLLKWYMKNKIFGAFEFYGAKKRKHYDVDINAVAIAAPAPQNNIFIKELFELVMENCSAQAKKVFSAILQDENIDFFDNGKIVWKSLSEKVGMSMYRLRSSLSELKTLYRDYVIEGG